MIPFNKPYFPKIAAEYLSQAYNENELYRGKFYNKCTEILNKKFNFNHIIPTPSCTSALEFVARLINIKQNDEVIIPAYTYVATANAFASFGAKIVFADSEIETPNISPASIKKLINKKTKAIVLVHYGGYACQIDEIKKIIKNSKRKIFLIEDAAHALGTKYKEKYIGNDSDFATFSFHETKNINCGQGGILVINNAEYIERAEIIKENGTNRKIFLENKADKYTWLDIGSNYNLNELSCAILYAGLQETEEINKKRKKLCRYYYDSLLQIKHIELPPLDYIENNNGHIFYIISKSRKMKEDIINKLNIAGVQAASHYEVLHKTPYFLTNFDKIKLKNAEKFSNQLVRLPLYYTLTTREIDKIVATLKTII
jgi:dTDP-4-amino-4,6-dideoxygalactose transaminase